MSYDPAFQQRIYEMLQESQYWTPAQMRAFQEQQLSQLLKFARDTVPFYKDRLAKVLNSDGRVNWDRWRDIPILKRDDLITHRDAMLAPTLPPGHGYIGDHLGSGTTGTPVTSRHNSLVPLVSQAALYRAWGWHDMDYSKVICHYWGDDPAVAQWPDGEVQSSLGPSWSSQSRLGQNLLINRDTSPERVAEYLVRKSVSYLAGRPRSVQSVALAAEQQGMEIKLMGLPTLSTGADETARADCRRVFGAEIISSYASKEVYNIAHQCDKGLNYHVNAELLFLEVLDGNGNECKPGERGNAIVTSFYNTSQPFIRYDIGDQLIMGERCSCGRTLPSIEKIAGRTTHLFRFPGGRKIAPSVAVKYMPLIGATAWQFAQIGPLQIEVRFISDGNQTKQNFAALTKLVRTRTDERVKVSYKAIDQLPVTPSGKFIEFVCELPPDN